MVPSKREQLDTIVAEAYKHGATLGSELTVETEAVLAGRVKESMVEVMVLRSVHVSARHTFCLSSSMKRN